MKPSLLRRLLLIMCVRHVAMLVEEAAAALDVGGEEGGCDESHRHYLGAREAGLRVVAMSDGLQKLL